MVALETISGVIVPSIPLHVVILAAGEGKRMCSRLAKVLQPIAGRPMLTHVVHAANALAPEAIHVVYGHHGDQVRDALRAFPYLRWVRQERQKGTGHAVQCVMPDIPDEARVLVLYGDAPLITTSTLCKLLEIPHKFVVLASKPQDPSGYGRLICDTQGNVVAVIEHHDAKP